MGIDAARWARGGFAGGAQSRFVRCCCWGVQAPGLEAIDWWAPRPGGSAEGFFLSDRVHFLLLFRVTRGLVTASVGVTKAGTSRRCVVVTQRIWWRVFGRISLGRTPSDPVETFWVYACGTLPSVFSWFLTPAGGFTKECL